MRTDQGNHTIGEKLISVQTGKMKYGNISSEFWWNTARSLLFHWSRLCKENSSITYFKSSPERTWYKMWTINNFLTILTNSPETLAHFINWLMYQFIPYFFSLEKFSTQHDKSGLVTKVKVYRYIYTPSASVVASSTSGTNLTTSVIRCCSKNDFHLLSWICFSSFICAKKCRITVQWLVNF